MAGTISHYGWYKVGSPNWFITFQSNANTLAIYIQNFFIDSVFRKAGHKIWTLLGL